VVAPDRSARWCGACGAALRVEVTAPSRRSTRAAGTPGPVEPGPVESGPDAGPRDRGRLIAAGALVAVIGGLLVTQATEESPPVPAGFTVRGDAARTGIVSTDAVLEPAGVAWTAQVALPALVVDGTQVLGTTRVGASSAGQSAPVGGREVAVVLAPATDGQRIAVHDVATGALEWTTMLPLGSQPWDTDVGDGLVAHRTLDSVTLLDLETHQRRWTVPVRLSQASTVTADGVVGVPAVSDGLSLVLLAHADGAQRWRWRAPTDGTVDELRPLRDAVLVEWRDLDEVRHLTRVDLATGDTRWDLLLATVVDQISFPSPGLAVDRDVALLAGAEGSALIDLTDGSVVALTETLDRPVGAKLTHRDGQPLAVLYDGFGRVAAFGMDGPRWSIEHTRSPIFGLTVAGNVVAVRGDSDITLLSLDDGGVMDRVTLASASLGEVPLAEDGAALLLGVDATLEAYAAAGTRWKAPTIAFHLPDMVTSPGELAITIPTGVEVRDVIDGTRRFAHDAFDVALVRAGTLTPPALVRGRVIVAPAGTQPANRGGMRALFADDGTTSWSRDDDQMPVRGTPVVFDELVVLAVGSQLHGYRVRDGSRGLVMETSAPREHVAIGGDTIVATDLALNAGDVWGGRPSDSTRRFRIEVRTCAPPTIVEDRFLLVTDEGNIFARSVEDGEAVWGERAGGSACRPFSIAGQTAVSLVDDRMLVGIDLDTGATTWRAELGATASAAPVVAGETLLVPTMAGTLEAWDVGADAPTWTINLGGVAAGAAAVEDGTIMVLLRDGRLVGLR
jgi:outer membrane protein assembly factor BamB